MFQIKRRRVPCLIIIIFAFCTCFYTLVQLQQLQLSPIGQLLLTRGKPNRTRSPATDPWCMVPEVDPFHWTIRRFIISKRIPNCKKENPPFFNSTLDSELIPAITLETFRSQMIKSCCYRLVIWKTDYEYIMPQSCYPISLEYTTKIKSSHEFIAIYCERDGGTLPFFVEVHAFVHLKREIEEKLKFSLPPSVDKPNVIVLVIDSISRANFLRWLPNSHEFLMKKMDAVEMKGYNKIGDYTFPHLVALTTSLDRETFREICANGKTSYYNQLDCPFIWKDFSENGYRTAYVEDVYVGNTFNNDYIMQNVGFLTPPADYYPRAFCQISDEHYREKGNSLYAYMCHGPRLLFETLLDYMKKFIYKMNQENKSFFGIFWETALTHDDMNNARIAEEPLKQTLSWLHENQQLENSVFILMSDHGQPYGDMRATPQGQLEYMLPFVYFVLPKSFKERYSKAYENLWGNRRSLITAIDLHYTLKDLVNLKNLREEPLQQREMELRNQSTYPPEGISLFLPIPIKRTCSQAGINLRSCSCSQYRKVSLRRKSVINAVKTVVKYINERVSKVPNCAVVSLSQIKMAQKLSHSSDTYRLNFNTQPGNAKFEAVVLKKGKNRPYKVSKVMRTNAYGNQSVCVENSKELKEFCYCIN